MPEYPEYLKILDIVHAVLRPRNYVEIGCAHGASLSLARCPSIGIDPNFAIMQRLVAPTRLYRETSDKFFTARRLSQEIGGPFDLAFIDGLHLADVAFRDFVNLERYSSPASVVLIDDVLPSDITWAQRRRAGKEWTGDLYKLPILLKARRPDLDIEVFDVEKKGLAIISRLDSGNRILWSEYKAFQAVLSGHQFELSSVGAIRNALQPRPVTTVVQHLNEIVARRASLSAHWKTELSAEIPNPPSA